MKNLIWAALLGTSLLASGCYQEIYDAVVDKSDTSPGGTVVTDLSGTQVASLPGLASGNPMLIESSTPLFDVSITAGDDLNGLDAHSALGAASVTLTLPIGPDTRSAAQLHFMGSSCVAATGTIVLATDTELKITGTFDATGTIGDSSAPCTLSGTITSIPQSR